MAAIEKPGVTRRSTDALALSLFQVLRRSTKEDLVLVYQALKASQKPAGTARSRLVEASIERFLLETDGPLSKKRYEAWRKDSADRSIPSATFIANTYDHSWSKAMDAVGVEPSLDHSVFRLKCRGRAATNEEVLNGLILCARELGADSVRFYEYQEWARRNQATTASDPVYLVSAGAFISRFGSWAGACLAAGLRIPRGSPSSGKTGGYTHDDLIQAVQQGATEIGEEKYLSTSQYSKWREKKVDEAALAGTLPSIPSLHTLHSCLGSWTDILESAGLPSGHGYSRGRGQRVSEQQIALGVIRATEELGACPTIHAYRAWRERSLTDISVPRPPSVTLLKSKFQKWGDLEKAVRSALETENPVDTLEAFLMSKGLDGN